MGINLRAIARLANAQAPPGLQVWWRSQASDSTLRERADAQVAHCARALGEGPGPSQASVCSCPRAPTSAMGWQGSSLCAHSYCGCIRSADGCAGDTVVSKVWAPTSASFWLSGGGRDESRNPTGEYGVTVAG